MSETIHLMFGPVPKRVGDMIADPAEADAHAPALVRVLADVGVLDALELAEGGRTAQALWYGGPDVRDLGRAGLFRTLQRARIGYEISEWPEGPDRQEPIGRQISWRPGLSRELVRLSDQQEGITITESIFRRLIAASHPEGLLGDYFLTQIVPLGVSADVLAGPGQQRYGRLIAALGDIGRAWR